MSEILETLENDAITQPKSINSGINVSNRREELVMVGSKEENDKSKSPDPKNILNSKLNSEFPGDSESANFMIINSDCINFLEKKGFTVDIVKESPITDAQVRIENSNGERISVYNTQGRLEYRSSIIIPKGASASLESSQGITFMKIKTGPFTTYIPQQS